jgi:hypothetical protein
MEAESLDANFGDYSLLESSVAPGSDMLPFFTRMKIRLPGFLKKFFNIAEPKLDDIIL